MEFHTEQQGCGREKGLIPVKDIALARSIEKAKSHL
jgi:hypothetical protein